MYKCEHCGIEFSVVPERCPGCNAILSGVRCQLCRYVGTKREFAANGNRCPKCNSAVYYGGGSQSADSNICQQCGANTSGTFTCPNCGHTEWVPLIVVFVFGLGLLATYFMHFDKLF